MKPLCVYCGHPEQVHTMERVSPKGQKYNCCLGCKALGDPDKRCWFYSDTVRYVHPQEQK